MEQDRFGPQRGDRDAGQAAARLIARPTRESGASLPVAARLVARGKDAGYTLRRVVEWTIAATGARRAILWAVDGELASDRPLVMLAWATTDDWRPGEQPAPPPVESAALARALRQPHSIIVDSVGPGEREQWQQAIGAGPVMLCAAVSSGVVRGVLGILGPVSGEPAQLFGAKVQSSLAACATLAAIIFERRDTGPLLNRAVAASDSAESSTPAPPVITPAPVVQNSFQALPDRAVMLARLTEEIKRAKRFGHPLALLHLDIDRLTKWGAAAGETAVAQLLAELTDFIRGTVRDVDLLGRGGPGQYLLILPMSKMDDALRAGERIRQRLALRTRDRAGRSLSLSGGAVAYPSDGESAEELLKAAEQAGAYARRMGGDQIRVHGLGAFDQPSPGMGVSIRPAAGASSEQKSAIAPSINRVFQGLIDALVVAGDAHDHAREGHGQAVARYAHDLAEACGLAPDQVKTIELAGLLHDVGKIGLPAEVIGKRTPLTAEERAILREQPAVGKMLLQQVPSLGSTIPLVEHVHERYDGRGYPDGLRAMQIPLGSRIIMIAEGYDAMTSDRPYRRALSHSMAVAELWREAGGRYDPRLVDTFVRLVSPPAVAIEPEGWNPELLERIEVVPGQTGELTLSPSAPASSALDLDEVAPESVPDPESATPGPPREPSVDDTLLIMRDSTLQRMVELGQQRRRAGYLRTPQSKPQGEKS